MQTNILLMPPKIQILYSATELHAYLMKVLILTIALFMKLTVQILEKKERFFVMIKDVL